MRNERIAVSIPGFGEDGSVFVLLVHPSPKRLLPSERSPPKALEYPLSAHSSRWQKKLSAPPESSLSSRQPRKLCLPCSFRAPSRFRAPNRFSSHGLFIPLFFYLCQASIGSSKAHLNLQQPIRE